MILDMTKLNVNERKTLISDAKEGLSLSKLSKKYKISRQAVKKIKEKFNVNVEHAPAGRPRKLNLRDEHLISRQIRKGECDTATEIVKKNLGLNVSPQTIRRCLRRQGLISTTKIKKPFLMKRHMKCRLEFAEAHRHWTKEDWQQVIFSDESKINRFWSDGRKWCWKNPHEPLNARIVDGTMKYGGGSIMIWGCITAKGPGYLTKIDSKLNAELYCQILNDEMMQTCQYYNLNTKDIIFQQDNDPKHTSRKAKEWFVDNDINVLPWPAQSPDLNPVENIWALLKRRLNQYETLPSGMLELWDRTSKVWNEILPRECLDVIESMPARVQAVIKAKGGYIKY